MSKLDAILAKDVLMPYERVTITLRDGSKHILLWKNCLELIRKNINGRRYQCGQLGAEKTLIGVIPVAPPAALDDQGRPNGAAALATLQSSLWFHETFSAMAADNLDDENLQAALLKNQAGLIGVVLESDAAQATQFSDSHLMAHSIYMTCSNLHPDDQNNKMNREVVALMPIYDEVKINRERKGSGQATLTGE